MTLLSLPSVAEREHTAQKLASTTALHLAFAVDRRDSEMISILLGSLTRQELLALTVVLADMVPMPLSRPDDGVFDEVAVQRAADGDPVPLTESERAAACRVMALRGDAVGRIASTLHMGVAAVKTLIALDVQADGQLTLADLRDHYEARRSA